ncbi:MAG TPA: terminase, partial [Candidatus Thermoplasmatota archaeon]|nr:terminase [Candidatus Thermoplasmatota archaeon]
DNIEEIIRIDKTKTWECVDKTKQLIAEKQIDPERVCIDSVGIGAGVCDELEKEGYNIISFKGGNACDQEITGTNFTFKNMRAYSNWLLADQFKKKLIGGVDNSRLISDCGAIKYEIKNDKNIFIKSKEEIKKKLKRSPDYWDSLTYANWARMYDKIQPKPGTFSL